MLQHMKMAKAGNQPTKRLCAQIDCKIPGL